MIGLIGEASDRATLSPVSPVRAGRGKGLGIARYAEGMERGPTRGAGRGRMTLDELATEM